MGIDIAGWVEVLEFNQWKAVIRVTDIVSRNYDAFGCLFGVMNSACFEPLAAGRGVPDDASDELITDFLSWEDDAFDPTWIGWEELANLDPGEAALEPDQRFTRYLKLEGGGLVKVDKAGMYAFEHERTGQWQTALNKELPDELEIEHGGFLYRRERMTRGDALLDSSWTRLRNLMALLAVDYGPANVRLVVWFCR